MLGSRSRNRKIFGKEEVSISTIDLILEPLKGKIPLAVANTVYPERNASFDEVHKNINEQLKTK